MSRTRLIIIFFGLLSTAGAEAASPQLPSLKWEPHSDWLNVRDFGATGDGQSDDTAAIQKRGSASLRLTPLHRRQSHPHPIAETTHTRTEIIRACRQQQARQDSSSQASQERT